MNKCAEFLNEMNKTGMLTPKGIEKIYKDVKALDDFFEKNAGLKINDSRMLDFLKAMGIVGGASLGVSAIGKGLGYLHDKITTPGKTVLDRVVMNNPSLRAVPEEKLEKIFNIVVQYSPELAKNDDVLASIMQKIVDFGGSVDPATLRELIGMQKEIKSYKTGLFDRETVIPPFGMSSSLAGHAFKASPDEM